VADLRHTHADRSTQAIVEALVEGRRAHCDEVVFLRGEPTIHPDIEFLISEARNLGYELIQLQSNGRMFAIQGFAEKLIKKGMTHVEVSLYGDIPAIHDAIAAVDGAFEQTCLGIGHLSRLGVVTHLNIPLVRANEDRLSRMVSLAATLGVKRIQFNFQRPISTEDGGSPQSATRLQRIKERLHIALEKAHEMGMACTTEGIPFCILDGFSNLASDRFDKVAPSAIRIDDLHRTTEDLNSLRHQYRSPPSACSSCREIETCPITWSSYLEQVGTDELQPI